ncbi:MAG: hypothetical protein A2Y15_05450 [Clostridiales bacterium GWF2_36_10]|nr:MAG: hypothetical protein A2Y15_05450 [Clostridiales bacterium GWF2_36_10]HAN20109.1 DUF3298/DUF4163 domain-containing protein [Clostridiales bacterium]
MERVSVNTISIKSNFSYNGDILLSYKIEYPEFVSTVYKQSLARINMFYKTKAMEYKKYCETKLLSAAQEQYKSDIENNFPIRTYEAVLTYELTYSISCIISLYFDKYEYTGGAHGTTARDSQTFNLQKGYMLSLSQLINCSPNYKTFILEEVKKQIEQDTSIYFDDYDKLIVDTFNKNNFYCTPQGIIFYYQHYDIAPYSSGIREFLIYYSDCVLDPQKTCFIIK